MEIDSASASGFDSPSSSAASSDPTANEKVSGDAVAEVPEEGADNEEEEEEDVCRICRNPGESDNPIPYPCACSGSINFIHHQKATFLVSKKQDPKANGRMVATRICLQILPPPSLRPPPPSARALPGPTSKWALRQQYGPRPGAATGSAGAAATSKGNVKLKQLVEFLYEDLPHLFDDQGIDRKAYDKRVKFRDPITKHDTIAGYLFNISLLKYIFRPLFQLHWVKPTGEYEITTRWTMQMTFMLLPWKPELIFTGTSVMGINPETGKFCSHVDFWDSIKNNDYFSTEGLMDVIKQLRIYKTPDLETPRYTILKRTANYEVRKYAPFIVVETTGENLSGSTGFNDVAGYIFGKNSTSEKIPMTTPVFTQANDTELSKVSIQIVLPIEKDMNSLPAPNQEKLRLRNVEGGTAAVLKFSGKPEEVVVREKEKMLRTNLVRDGLKPKTGCLLARYNDPGRTWSFTMRNEVLIWLEEFSLDE